MSSGIFVRFSFVNWAPVLQENHNNVRSTYTNAKLHFAIMHKGTLLTVGMMTMDIISL